MKKLNLSLIAAAFLSASVAAHAATTYSIGGAVTGLASGATVSVTDASAGTTAASNGSYTLPSGLASGTAYNVSINSGSIPSGYSCTIANGSGTVGTNNVTNVNVTCQSASGTPPAAPATPPSFLTGASGSDDIYVDEWGNTWNFAVPSVTDINGNVLATGSQVQVATVPGDSNLVSYQIAIPDSVKAGQNVYLNNVIFGCRPDLGHNFGGCKGAMSFEWDTGTGQGSWKLVGILGGAGTSLPGAMYVDPWALQSDYTAALQSSIKATSPGASGTYPVTTTNNMGVTMTQILNSWIANGGI